jgi:hypothetical protein
MKLTLSNNKPEAEIPFWIFCEGLDCAQKKVLLVNDQNTSQSPIPIPLVHVPGRGAENRWGAELIIPESGQYSLSLDKTKESLTVLPHRNLSFGEEFVWVFSAVVLVLGALFVFGVKKSQADRSIHKGEQRV